MLRSFGLGAIAWPGAGLCAAWGVVSANRYSKSTENRCISVSIYPRCCGLTNNGHPVYDGA